MSSAGTRSKPTATRVTAGPGSIPGPATLFFKGRPIDGRGLMKVTPPGQRATLNQHRLGRDTNMRTDNVIKSGARTGERVDA